MRFAAVGVASTLAYLLLFLLLRPGSAPRSANLLALLVTAVANTAANRRLTFGVRGRAGAARTRRRAWSVFALGLALTSGSLVLLHASPTPSRSDRGGRAGRGQPGRDRAAVPAAARVWVFGRARVAVAG